MTPANARLILLGVACFAVSAGVLLWRTDPLRPGADAAGPSANKGGALRSSTPASGRADAATDSDAYARLLARLAAPEGARGARANEAVVTFKDAAALERFLAAAAAAGLEVRARIDGLLTVRVAARSAADLARGLLPFQNEWSEAGPNPYVFTPQPPPAEARAAQRHLAFGNRTLEFLGITGDHGGWGRGVTIAIIDSGVAPDATFAPGRVRSLDLGLGVQAADGHGTAVAALAAGESADAPGVAPAASILSIRVTDTEGLGDTFTVAQAIVAATDAGARVLNLSLGAYQDHPTLSRAVGYALERGAVVVASAGNDQAGVLTWPAADPRVISVGSIDALEQQVTFSNSGETLSVTAPGYGVKTAWLENQRVSFSGTSASAPLVAGAIAAVMSQNPGVGAAGAWEILAAHTNEAGAPGADARYGQGILNVGWAMARTDPTRVDTAVASHHFNEAAGRLEVVVQNRSNLGVAGLQLAVQTAAGTSTNTLRWLGPGATSIVTVPINPSALRSGEVQVFRSELINPAGVADVAPANNRKTSSLQTAP